MAKSTRRSGSRSNTSKQRRAGKKEDLTNTKRTSGSVRTTARRRPKPSPAAKKAVVRKNRTKKTTPSRKSALKRKGSTKRTLAAKHKPKPVRKKTSAPSRKSTPTRNVARLPFEPTDVGEQPKPDPSQAQTAVRRSVTTRRRPTPPCLDRPRRVLPEALDSAEPEELPTPSMESLTVATHATNMSVPPRGQPDDHTGSLEREPTEEAH